MAQGWAAPPKFRFVNGVAVPMPATQINLATQVMGTLGHANGGTDVTSPGANNNCLVSNGSNWTSVACPGGGTVTSVSWTGGIVSIANPTTTPAFTIAGTSGGIPYFSSSSTWASSAVLGSSLTPQVIVGNGAGNAPTTLPGGDGQILFTSGSNSTPAFSSTPYLGSAIGAVTGILGMYGSGGGRVSVQAVAATGTYNFNLPTTAGSAGAPLVSGGGGSTAMTYGSGTSPITISAAGAFGCATCATTTNGGALSGTAPVAISAGGAISINANGITSTQLAAQYSKLRCEPGLGDGLNAMTAGTYLQSTCYNDSGVTWTITAIKCFTDNNGTSTLNAAGNTLGALLTGAVTCTNSFAAGTQSANVALTSTDYIKFTFVADGTSKQTTWVVSFTQ
jgi:hypothetical protein